ncbi:hypothetical protein [Mycolicibacterium helvum]|uniref:Uncharacterized protein n=1 Tax=Mycolicibacterium helvum TaxID=1534349 RepID=A0A7I7T323_9MYCO|nr:hypothetical protein [Mycolicibacterium helvum]BBY62486.1 hypothetical protein MHEL_07290 [Mycolicibacterium helvum]
MRRGIGAIFSTGMALVVATVVVANPVSAPPSDIRVPAVKLSGDSAVSNAALDRALFAALARNPADSGPAILFKRSVAGVVTNVTLLSGRAVKEASRVRPVVDAASAPAAPPPPSVLPKAVADLLSGALTNVVATNLPAATIDDRALRHAVTSVGDYVGYVSVKAVEVTNEAGTIAPASPKRIAETLATLTHGVDTTITAALRAVAAPLAPPSMAVQEIRTEVRKQLTELADRLRRSVPAPPRIVPVTRPAPVDRTTSSQATLGHGRGTTVTTKPAASTDRTDPGLTKHATVNGATDLSDGNKAVPHKKAPQSPLRQRAEATLSQVRDSLNQARDALEHLGNALPKAAAPPKPARPHRH